MYAREVLLSLSFIIYLIINLIIYLILESYRVTLLPLNV